MYKDEELKAIDGKNGQEEWSNLQYSQFWLKYILLIVFSLELYFEIGMN